MPELPLKMKTAGATITGADNGIYAINNGTGALSITTTGDTEGTTGDGIYAYNEGTDLTINAATTTGGEMAFMRKTMALAP